MFESPSFRINRTQCVSTVRALMPKVVAISWRVSPRPWPDGKITPEQALANGGLAVEGASTALAQLLSLFDSFPPYFPLLTPPTSTIPSTTS